MKCDNVICTLDVFLSDVCVYLSENIYKVDNDA